jgi:lysophospholipase L1-like esterase
MHRALFQPPAHSARWEAEIRRFEEQDRTAPPTPGSILFLGSSTIRLWKTLRDDFPGLPVLNRGFGGSTIADSTAFVDRIVTPYRPRRIVFYAGDNDLAEGLLPGEVVRDFEAFVRRVRRDLPDTGIAFLAIKPSLARAKLQARAREVNGRIKQFASRTRGVEFIDTFTPMLTPAGDARPELFGPDGLHMNRDGYALWRDIVAPALGPR